MARNPYSNQDEGGQQNQISNPLTDAVSSVTAFVTDFDRLSAAMERTNSLFTAFANFRRGSFNRIGDEVLNIIKPLDRLNYTFSSVNSGVTALGINISKQFDASSVSVDTLASKIDKVRTAFLSLPTQLLHNTRLGIQDEQRQIGQAASVQVAGYASSNIEARSLIARNRFRTTQESAALPGDTRIHLDVLDATIGQALRVSRIANQSVEQAEDFAVKSAGKIASIAAIAGADRQQTIRFAQEIFSGGLSINSPLALVQTNPLLQQGVSLTLRKYGAQQFAQIPITQQKKAIEEILEYAASSETLGAAGKSVEGQLQTFQTNLFNLHDFSRVTGQRQGVDVSVYNEIQPLIIKYYSAINDLLAYLNDSRYSPLKLLTEVSQKIYGNFGGTGQRQGAFEGQSFDFARFRHGFFDYLQWFQDNLTRLRPQFDKSPGLLLNVIVSGIGKFGQGFTNAMSYVNTLLQKRFEYGIGVVNIGSLLGTLLADIINSIIRGLNPLGDTLRSLIANFFESLMGRLDKVAAFNFLNNIQATRAFYGALLSKFINFTRPNEDPKGITNKLLTTALTGTALYSGFSGIRRAILENGQDLSMFSGFLKKAHSGLSVFALGLPLIGPQLHKRIVGLGNAVNRNRATRFYRGVQNQARRSRDRHEAAVKAGGIFADPAEFLFGRFVGRDHVAELAKKGLNTRISGFANVAGNIAGHAERLSGVLPLLSSAGIIPAWLGNAAVAGYLGSTFAHQALRIGSSHKGISSAVQNFGSGGGGGILGIPKAIFKGATELPVIGGVFSLFGGLFGKLRGFLGALFSVEGLGVLFQSLPRFLGWIGLMVTFFKALYNNSDALRKAVNRWMTFFRSIFEFVGLAFGQIWDRFLRPIFKILGDALAFVLNFVADIFGIKKDPGVEEADANLLQRRSEDKQEKIIEGRKRTQIGLPLYGEQQQLALGFGAGGYHPVAGFAAGGYNVDTSGINKIPLINAASMERAAAPINTSLIVANSSETIRTAEQEHMLQKSLLSRAGTISIPQINFNIYSQTGNADEIANRVAGVFTERIKQLSAEPK